MDNVDTNQIAAAEAYQDMILPGVSRTFALTIVQLPPGLRSVMTNAYLLCRITDTIEDDAGLSLEQKAAFHQNFTELLNADASAQEFVDQLYPLLSDGTSEEERELIKNTPLVISYTLSLNPKQRQALQRCVTTMSQGMPQFESEASLDGLASLSDMNRYCYYVAGVVGEMITDLLCDYSSEIAQHRERMLRLAPSFGQGLQMTNILKDIWEDRQRGVCWLPRDLFQQHGFNLNELSSESYAENYGKGMQQLIGIAYTHLHNALEYTLLIPRKEKGIRDFCLWAIALAELTLTNIYNKLDFKSGAEVKVPRNMVKLIILSTKLCGKSNTLLRWLFNLAGRRLPKPSHVELDNVIASIPSEY